MPTINLNNWKFVSSYYRAGTGFVKSNQALIAISFNGINKIGKLQLLLIEASYINNLVFLIIMVRILKIVPTVMVWYSRKLKRSIHLLKFPDGLLDRVLEYLETEELLQINTVCRRFNLLAGKHLWHSIFVSTPINDVAIGTPWANYRKIPKEKFMELLEFKKHKTKFMKRLVLGHMSVNSFDWFRNLFFPA